ncbi:zinc-finger-containing protein [Polaribacter aestuariivivens]|uniref:zinc-finger-containing protein n=1 Tax=Polaribacter aestuariivivens TaxID=2304626 RepID=UPI003F495C46
MELTAFQSDVFNGKICPYCKSKTKLLSELQVYGKTYKNRVIHACINYPKCDSYVGSHDDGIALGRLANHKLRIAKKKAHYYFDKIWKEKYVERSDLYEELSDYLNLPSEYTHIGMFSIETCRKVEIWSHKKYNNFKNL